MPGLAAAESSATIHIINADGSPAGMCGNAMRCIAQILTLETGQRAHWVVCGERRIAVVCDNGSATVNIGTADFASDKIPLASYVDPRKFNLLTPEYPIGIALSVGNPHLVLFFPDIASVNLPALAQKVRDLKVFTAGVNVNIAQIISRTHIKLRTDERGVGETLSCGSGACATLVAAVELGLAERDCNITQSGGNVKVVWKPDNTLVLAGPVMQSFTGIFMHDQLA